MYELSAGMLYFYDIANINKMIDPIELESFFTLMEVYGSDCMINENNVVPFTHSEKRLLAANSLNLFCQSITSKLVTLDQLKQSEQHPSLSIVINLC